MCVVCVCVCDHMCLLVREVCLSLRMCIIYYYITFMCTQVGMQPIHCAAIYGHIDVISILVERYGVDPQEKADVRTYVANSNMCVYT